MVERQLNEREREILKYLIQQFTDTAMPVPSHRIAKLYNLKLSPATIRNVMADLEEYGYLMHPHTSSGKVPTDKGYRLFVNSLMEIEDLTPTELEKIRAQLCMANEPDDLLRQTAKILGSISHQLSFVSTPHLRSAVLDRIELMSISSSKLLVLLTIETSIVKTITMEFHGEISQMNLYEISRLLNERLSGLTLELIRETFPERLKDYQNESSGIINLIIKSRNRIFEEYRTREKLHIAGTQSLVEQPEYGNPETFRTIIELIDNENTLYEVLERYEMDARSRGTSIVIGEEHGEEKLEHYSVIISTYNVGGVSGLVGVIGPKRMRYAKVIPLVQQLADEISNSLS